MAYDPMQTIRTLRANWHKAELKADVFQKYLRCLVGEMNVSQIESMGFDLETAETIFRLAYTDPRETDLEAAQNDLEQRERKGR